MKKFLCVFLSVILLLSLCVCFAGCGAEENVRGEITDGNQNQNENQNSTEPQQKETEPGQNDAEPEFSMGKATGSTYNNEFLGLSLTVPAGWEFATDEQIKEMNGIASEYLDEELVEQIQDAPIIYDMNAQNLADGSSVGVNLEKLGLAQLATLDIKQSLEAQIPAVKSAYEKIGYTDVVAEYQKVTVDGKEFDGITLSAGIQGVEFNMVAFAFRKGNYLANVTVGSLDAAVVQSLLDSFTVK